MHDTNRSLNKFYHSCVFESSFLCVQKCPYRCRCRILTKHENVRSRSTTDANIERDLYFWPEARMFVIRIVCANYAYSTHVSILFFRCEASIFLHLVICFRMFYSKLMCGFSLMCTRCVHGNLDLWIIFLFYFVDRWPSKCSERSISHHRNSTSVFALALEPRSSKTRIKSIRVVSMHRSCHFVIM